MQKNAPIGAFFMKNKQKKTLGQKGLHNPRPSTLTNEANGIIHNTYSKGKP